ncbi:hypothetical protein [Desulfomonile tiedjei]|uniref:Hydrophobin n=1 Tax=Desulfomonile tiedjei (strain ATCC 49306 / DSM 6799 / DCB-1) TaxID=706587 RepID=I4C017_DESTA|nr:hypothetical protein [Desulfomonile tiedjei]AFM22908.1 hypothetical protein Desti_0162 [Desulfomonile tiedjei DSM 6799]
MVKKSAVILGILAIMLVGAGISQGYTVSKWPVPGIPNTVYCGGSPCLPGLGAEDTTLRGPVAPACEPPLVPGVIHAALSVPFRALGLVASPLLAGQCPGEQCCKVELGEAAYVTAAVPCTPVNAYVPPRGW